MNGFVNLLKPVGLSSSEAVVKVKRLLSDIGIKTAVGHMGTLDPLACGVLPVGIGKATRLFDYFLKKKKEYIAVFKFGIETDTLDSCGKIVNMNDKIVSKDEINGILPKFIGEIYQIPPQYSAVSINGRRAYDIARSGKSCELKARRVSVDNIEVLNRNSDNTFTFDIKCGSGVYIRSLVRDIADELNTVGYMAALIRKKSGLFDINNSETIEEISDDINASIISIDKILCDMNTADFGRKDLERLKNGSMLDVDMEDGEYLIKENGNALAFARVQSGTIKLTVRLL